MDIICISGKARSGKDTIAQELRKVLTESGKRVIVTHYADFLKYICREYYHWDGEKDEYGRTLLQTVGQSFRDSNPDCWVQIMNGFISGLQNDIDVVIIADCRYKNELLELRLPCRGNIYTIRIERPNFDNQLTEQQKLHKSEVDLDDCLFNLYVNNDGDEDQYKAKAKRIMLEYGIFCGYVKNRI